MLIRPSPLSLFLGQRRLTEEFLAIRIEKKKNQVLVHIVPKENMPGVERVVLAYDVSKQISVELSIYDSLGNRNTIKFDNISINQKVADKFFQPSFGVGVVIIKQGS